MEGRKDGWTDKEMDGRVDGQRDGWKGERTDRWMVRRRKRGKDGLTDGRADKDS